MIDIEEVKKQQERKLKEYTLANEFEKETGVEPIVYSVKGRIYINFKNIDDATAGKILDMYEPTDAMFTPKDSLTNYVCSTAYSLNDKFPTLTVRWRYRAVELSVTIDLTNSCILGEWVHKKGTRKVASWEAESAEAVRRVGRIDFKQEVDQYAFNGDNVAYQGGHVTSNTPSVCDGVAQSLIDAYKVPKEELS